MSPNIVPFDVRYGFLLVGYTLYVKHPTSPPKNTATLKPGLGVTEGHWKWHRPIFDAPPMTSEVNGSTCPFSDIHVEKYHGLEIPVKGQWRSLEVVPFDRLCMVWLTFHSSHGPISYRFRNKRRFQSKNRNIFLTPVFCVGSPWNWVPKGLKSIMMGLPRKKKLLFDRFSRSDNTDVRQTDEQTLSRTANTALCRASRGEKAGCGF